MVEDLFRSQLFKTLVSVDAVVLRSLDLSQVRGLVEGSRALVLTVAGRREGRARKYNLQLTIKLWLGIVHARTPLGHELILSLQYCFDTPAVLLPHSTAILLQTVSSVFRVALLLDRKYSSTLAAGPRQPPLGPSRPAQRSWRKRSSSR